jgi:hypothetical protein
MNKMWSGSSSTHLIQGFHSESNSTKAPIHQLSSHESNGQIVLEFVKNQENYADFLTQFLLYEHSPSIFPTSATEFDDKLVRGILNMYP